MKKKILVAPLNWGLGHATRCIPIIHALMEHHYEPIIASDGAALDLLKKEFPTLIALELPSYHIQYTKHGFLLKWQFFKNSPKLFKAIKSEKKVVQNIIETYNITGVISDNRFGVFSINRHIPSVYITHQLNVYSGITTWLSTKMHQHIIKKHDECWVPDFENSPNLSGQLGHIQNHNLNLKYLGILSRFEKSTSSKIFDILVILSGPEPQRTLLEHKILLELKAFKKNIILVQGKVENTQIISKNNNLTIYNYMQSEALEKAIQNSHLIISRSGYTTIMDLAKLGGKVFFIPTPGQHEQIYLAKRLEKLNIAPYCKQGDFNMEKLNTINLYQGFKAYNNTVDFKSLFSLFQSK
ncbi:glycosyltransferase [Yeosuana sp.]|uniref:glycosyltransferase n=1 Tax=Yeosuana sp. TaxID=2529388 RepID=UPI004054F7BD